MDDKNNTGINNSGHWNSGHRNSGNWNSGNCNSGDCNSGNWNSGDCNSGHWNSGDRNSGDWNSGHWNSGDRNSGDRNSGDWNSGDWNSGFFNTNEPDYIRVFNTWVKMTPSEFLEKYNIYTDLPLNRWIDKEDMTDEEKENVNGWETMGGYLKTLDFKEACRKWWDENTDRHEKFLNLPNFDPYIFEEITGIDVRKSPQETRESDDELIAELKRRGRIKNGEII